MNVNDKVRKSGYALQSARNWWLSQGEYSRKQRAKDAYERAAAERGTVMELLPADESRGVCKGVRVIWDNGSESKCLPYMIEVVS